MDIKELLNINEACCTSDGDFFLLVFTEVFHDDTLPITAIC